MDPENGCEYGHILNQKVGDYIKRQESKVEGIETYIVALRDVKIPKVESKIEEAVKMAGNASCDTAMSRYAAEEAKKSVEQTRTFLTTAIITFVVAFLGVVGTSVYKIISDKQDQTAMISALHEKIVQDAKNQVETVNYLKQLENALRSKIMSRPQKF